MVKKRKGGRAVKGIGKLIGAVIALLLGLSCLYSLAAEELTIRQAIEIARENDGKAYLVRGTVKIVEDAALGRLTIRDGDGYTLYIHGIASMNTILSPGDEVLLLGKLTTYNGEARMVDAALQSHMPSDKEEPGPQPSIPETVTLDQALVIAARQINAFTQQQYILTCPVYKITAQAQVYLVDDAGNVLPVGCLENASQLVPGDILTVQGVLGMDGDKAQMRDTSVLMHIRSGPTYTGDLIQWGIGMLILSGLALVLLHRKRRKLHN